VTHFSGRAIVWCVVLILVALASASADQGTISIQSVGGLKSGTTVTAGANVRFVIKFNNTTGEKCDVANGFKLSSPDGATWDSTRIDSIGPYAAGASTYFVPFFDVAFSWMYGSPDGQGEDTVGCLGTGKPLKTNRQMPAGWNDTVFAITAYFDGNRSAAGKHICIDTSFYQPGGTWSWIGKSLTIYSPAFQGLTPSQPYTDGNPGTRLGSGYCFEIYAPQLAVTPNQLSFTCVKDGTPPSSQTFVVSSTGDALSDPQSFTLSESSPWMSELPTSGTTPRTVTLSINQTGLNTGTYVDSVRVSSTTSANSPQWVKVTLAVTTPPPTISTNKSSFTFVGVTGGTDPTPQTLIVKNIGGSNLNWHLSTSSTWLGLTPMSGIDSTQITISPHIIGLTAGTYKDTIVITDTLATNSPRKVAVTLSLGSDLPFIKVDSAVNHFVIDTRSAIPQPPCTIHITNGGIGSLTFTLTPSSNRLFNINPLSGSAPQDVVIGFKLLGDVAGTTKIDTLWVTSPEATNSPFPVIFYFHFTNNPAILSPTVDTIRLTTYACEPGNGGIMPTDSFRIQNIGGDNPIQVGLIHGSTYATISPDSGYVPYTVRARALNLDLPPGVYYDTILCTAINAINSPVRVILKYTRSTGDHQPAMLVSTDTFVVNRQEHTGNVKLNSTIENQYPGCMPWTASTFASWLSLTNTSGNVPSAFSALANIDGFTLGAYRDSILLVAPTASNSPKRMLVKVNVWRLHGDNNWDGIVDSRDLAFLISYLTTGFNMPLPEYVVGDMNCNGVVDLADLSSLVAYLQSTMKTICGNP
jgi:hypothetical protein